MTPTYETQWRRALASPDRRKWFARLWSLDLARLAPQQAEVVAKLRREWTHRTPMERMREQSA